MLSQKLLAKSHTYAVCGRSGDIEVGDTFIDVRFADAGPSRDVSGIAVVCCGKVSDDEMLFRSEDGRYYFSVSDGWGEEDGVLYGISRGLFFDFGHPTSEETILAECESALGEYHSWAGAMAHQSKKWTLEMIVGVMRRIVKNDGKDTI